MTAIQYAGHTRPSLLWRLVGLASRRLPSFLGDLVDLDDHHHLVHQAHHVVLPLQIPECLLLPFHLSDQECLPAQKQDTRATALTKLLTQSILFHVNWH